VDADLRASLDDLHARNTAHDAGKADRLERLRTVEPATAALLGVLARAARPERILEVGTSSGYSTIWLADAAQAIGGTVLSLDVDPTRTALAAGNVAAAGVTASVQLQTGDAAQFLPGVPAGAFGFVFLDAERVEYPAWYEDLVRVLAPGALVAADNAASHEAELAPWRALVAADPRLEQAFVPIGAGVVLAVRV
jgi:predicted O-methyltransferase YrrM